MTPIVLPDDRGARWETLGAWIDLWFPRTDAPAGFDAAEIDEAERRLGASLPVALRELYLRFGARSDVWSCQDRLLGPSELCIDHGVLSFVEENQQVVSWGVRVEDLSKPDPPVVVSDQTIRVGWLVESESTSAFACRLALVNAKWSPSAAYSGWGPCDPELLETVRSLVPRLPFSDSHWPAAPSRLYGHVELIVETQGDDLICVTARTESALAAVASLVGGLEPFSTM